MRPYQHLPLPMPSEYDPGPAFFYQNFVKHFIPDMLQMMDVGLNIDQEAVEKLRTTIDDVLESVALRLSQNPLMEKFRIHQQPAAQRAYEEKCTQAVRDFTHYLKEYKPGDMLHRTWVVNTYLKIIGRPSDSKDKWSIKDLKQYNIFLKDNLITAVISKRPLSANKYVVKGMKELAEYKAELWNRPRYEKAEIPVVVGSFNPNSNKQVKEFFEMLKIHPLEFSKDTGEASWGRQQLEELKDSSTDEDLLAVLDAFIDNSFSSIIKTNFLKAFDTFTIDGVLHGNIKLFGAKSFRNTSNSPNLLNAPSTESIYATPLKQCFISRKKFVIYTADLFALEDRVIANLSGDVNKCDIFLQGLDGHSLNACGYFPDAVEALIGSFDNNVDRVLEFMKNVKAKDKRFTTIRQDSKKPTFKLAYGGYPDSERGGVITQELFDNYHNVLYPGITKYREQYVLPTVRNQGYIHLGLGCRLYSNNASDHIRSLNNATVQFWSILTLIAINEFNYRIREDNMEDYVQVQSTIYDSIYTQTYREPEVIKWVNDNLIEVMTMPYLQDEVIHNEAEGDIGLNWADLFKISQNASIEEIQEVMKKL